jgi:hypothetical protein
MKILFAGISLFLLGIVKAGEVVVAPDEPTPSGVKAEIRAGAGGRNVRGRQLPGYQYLPVPWTGEINCDDCNESGEMSCNESGDTTICVPSTWDFYELDLKADTMYIIDVDRVDCEFDPALSLYRGDATGLPPAPNDEVCPFDEDLPGGTWIGFADDNRPSACPGPFGDPRLVVTTEEGGDYTLAVQDYISGDCDTGFEYNVNISPVTMTFINLFYRNPLFGNYPNGDPWDSRCSPLVEDGECYPRWIYKSLCWKWAFEIDVPCHDIDHIDWYKKLDGGGWVAQFTTTEAPWILPGCMVRPPNNAEFMEKAVVTFTDGTSVAIEKSVTFWGSGYTEVCEPTPDC